MSSPNPAVPARRRGRLKIFLGAAPGVGKTHEMLSDACERLREGEDVVVAAADTHGRPEMAALLDGLPTVPPRAGTRGEVDVDALLARAPGIAVIDALAFENGADARHPRRWQDATELMAGGIDVYATLDIRHVASLADLVGRTAKLPVGDAVPDDLFEEAELEVVDLPPDELIRRLEEGKVKVGEEESRVLAHYYSRPVLSALREMVLRRAAQSIDRRMIAELAEGATPGAYAGSERVLVAVSELPGGDDLVRAAKRLADALRGSLAAVHIETPRARTFDAAQKRRVAECLRLAATLGATIATVPAETVVEGLGGQVEMLRATQLVIGKSRRSWWFTLRHGSVVDAMMRVSDGLAVHVLPTIERVDGTRPRGGARVRTAATTGGIADYAVAVGLVLTTTLIGRLAMPLIGRDALDLLYLMPAIVGGVLLPFRPALFGGIAAALAYVLVFLGPRGAMTLEAPQAAVACAVLVGMAAFVNRLASRLRIRATLGVRSAQDNAAVAAFAQALARTSDRAGTARTVCEEVARLLDVDAILLAERDGALVQVAARPEGATLGPVDLAAAQWAWDRGEIAGTGTATLNAADWRFDPLKTSLGTLAVLGVACDDGREPVPADRAVLMSALVGQAALAHERLTLEDDMRGIGALRVREAGRAALLGAVADGLGAPLRAIAAGAADEGLRDEAGRLARLADDVAATARCDVVPDAREPIELVEAVSDAAHDIRDRLRAITIDLAVPGNLPRVVADRPMLHRALVNLLSAAAHGAAAGGAIAVTGRRVADAVELSVRGAPDDTGAPPEIALILARSFAEAAGAELSTAPGGWALRFPVGGG